MRKDRSLATLVSILKDLASHMRRNHGHQVDAEIALEHINNREDGEAKKKNGEREFDGPENNMNREHQDEQDAGEDENRVHAAILGRTPFK